MTSISYNLFLDDVRYPTAAWMNYFRQVSYHLYEWVVVRNYKEFVEAIEERGIPNFVSYDHDLHDSHYDRSMFESRADYEAKIANSREKTGLECAKYLVEKLNGERHPNYTVHSQNPVGKQRISQFIDNYNDGR